MSELTLSTTIGLAILLIIGLAALFPGQMITGNVISDEDVSCGELGCFELCDDACSTDGMVCCTTHWDSGICEYPQNCELLRQRSLYQTLETYQDSVREQPRHVTSQGAFFSTILAVLLVIIGIVWTRHK